MKKSSLKARRGSILRPKNRRKINDRSLFFRRHSGRMGDQSAKAPKGAPKK
jgi:hypothetical protein